jgi:hypothetical protein
MSSISDFDLHLEISYSWKVCQIFSLRLHNYHNLVVNFFNFKISIIHNQNVFTFDILLIFFAKMW